MIKTGKLNKAQAPKMAIVCQITLNKATGSGYLLHFARLFSKLGIHVEIFSLSDSRNTSDIYGFRQNQVNLPNPGSTGSPLSKAIDFLVLSLFGTKPSINRMSRSRALTDMLHNYKPDILFVVDPLFVKTLQRYKLENPKVRIITYTDSLGSEFNFTFTRSINSNNPSLPMVKLLTKLLKKSYFKYQAKAYRDMIDVSDAFVLPAKYHEEKVLKRFKNAKGKTFSILGSFITKDRVQNSRKIKSIKKILFLSAYSPGPYMAAIHEIETKIAPALPDKQFIIHGPGCPERTTANVKFSGKYLPFDELFNRVDLCLSPLPGENTGYKLKVFDYLAAGMIVMGTTQSFIGYDVTDNINAIIEDNISRYPERIKELDKNPRLLIKIQRNARRVLKHHYEKDAMRQWLEVLRYIGVVK